MRIGLSTATLDRGRSGEGQYVLELVRALLPETKQHEFVLFVLEADRPLLEFAARAMRFVTVSEVHRPPLKNFLWHQLTLPHLASELALDVLHVPSHRRLLWPRPCPLVATVHDLGEFRTGGPRRWPDRQALIRRLTQRQDEIVAVSRATADDLTRLLGVPPGRVTVVHNGIDHQRFTPADREVAAAYISRRYGVPPPFFLSVAPLEHPTKNHIRLVSAFNLFKTITPSPWQLLLVGADGHGADVVHQAVQRSPYAQDIHCLGFVAESDLPHWYRAATAFVHPALFEGFGLPVLEAMACGAPVIASAAPSISEHVARIVAATDVADLAKTIVELLRDEQMRNSLSARGLKHVEGFSWQRTARMTLEVYQQALR